MPEQNSQPIGRLSAHGPFIFLFVLFEANNMIPARMGYLYLAIAIIAEVIGTSALKASDGFSKSLPSTIVLIGYGVAFYFLSLVLKTIPVGVAYAIWSGAGIALISIIGVVVFKQILDAPAFIGIGLIIAGVAVINLFSKSAAHQ